jgi:hypothetical protein
VVVGLVPRGWGNVTPALSAHFKRGHVELFAHTPRLALADSVLTYGGAVHFAPFTLAVQNKKEKKKKERKKKERAKERNKQIIRQSKERFAQRGVSVPSS